MIFSKNFKKNINLVSKIGGIILLITGILILTNQLQALGFYLLNIFPFLTKFWLNKNMKIYQIDSSARKEGSSSRALAKKLLDKIKNLKMKLFIET